MSASVRSGVNRNNTLGNSQNLQSMLLEESELLFKD